MWFRVIALLCRLSPAWRELDKYLRNKGYHRTLDGRWENAEFEVLPSPRWQPKAIDVYKLADKKWAGWTLIWAIGHLEDGIGL